MGFSSSLYPSMIGENVQIYNVKITGKCNFEPSLLLGMIWSLVPCVELPHKFSIKSFSPICHGKLFWKKGYPLLYEEDTMPLPYWKMMWGSVLTLVNILELAKEFECCYCKPLWVLHHVSPILRQISEHLIEALLIKLLGQFIEVHKNEFFL